MTVELGLKKVGWTTLFLPVKSCEHYIGVPDSEPKSRGAVWWIWLIVLFILIFLVAAATSIGKSCSWGQDPHPPAAAAHSLRWKEFEGKTMPFDLRQHKWG